MRQQITRKAAPFLDGNSQLALVNGANIAYLQQLILSPRFMVTDLPTDFGHPCRQYRRSLVAPLLADISQHSGDFLVAPIESGPCHLAKSRHSRGVVVCSCSLNRALQSIKDDANQ